MESQALVSCLGLDPCPQITWDIVKLATLPGLWMLPPKPCGCCVVIRHLLKFYFGPLHHSHPVYFCPGRADLDSQCQMWSSSRHIPLLPAPPGLTEHHWALLTQIPVLPIQTLEVHWQGSGCTLPKNLARALRVIHLFFFFFLSFILRWTVIHPEWGWAGKSPLLRKLLSCVIFTRCLANQSISLLYQTGMS